MNPATSNEEEAVLEGLYGSADFEFDLKGVHSDVGNLFQQFAKKEIIKSTLNKNYEKAKQLKEAALSTKKGIDSKRDQIRQALKLKKEELKGKLADPPFLRTTDKIAFTMGIVGLCLTEYFVLCRPEFMPNWYLLLIFPLLIARYVMYYRMKYQYFMLDFCYFVQILLLTSTFYWKDPTFFQIVFSLSNGPLCSAIVMWRNSLVFHDLDKITSVFIHIFPPLVTFCSRWYPPNGDFSLVCAEKDCYMSFWNAIVYPFAFYILWQILYLVKTEVIDKDKLDSDKDLMTSLRYLTEYKPHPIYKLMVKKGFKFPPYVALVLVQAVYTLFTMVPNLFIFNSFIVHSLYLCVIFLCCVWNGANFYFDIFSKTYSQRLQAHLKESEKASSSEIKTVPLHQKSN
jgi:hypothetical protein